MVLGKTNCDEFAMGWSNENSAYGPVRNPRGARSCSRGIERRFCGGGGGGLAVATLGTDTGGSIRQPGAFCGIPGMMPTYGRVSRYGLIAFASSLDRIGPFARSVRDAAELLSVIAGRDPLDSTSADVPTADYAKGLEHSVRGLRIGVPTDYFGAGLDPVVREKIEAGIAAAERLGCHRVPLRMPHTDYAVAPITCWQPPKPALILRVTTACATACGCPALRWRRCTERRAGAASAPK